jgi:hypothetical protein
MSLCYDFSKWTMISLASIAISLTIGLVSLAYGQSLTQEEKIGVKELLNYCYQHASDPNPIQDLIDKGFLPKSLNATTCLEWKQYYDIIKSAEPQFFD